MASPQLENGHTRIANELLEEIYKSSLSLREMKIVLVVIRYTFGFQRKTAELSIRFLSQATGIKYRHTQSTVSALIRKGVLVVDVEAIGTTSRKIRLNKNYETWNFSIDRKGIANSELDTTEKVSLETTERVSLETTEKVSKKENLKKTLKKGVAGSQSSLTSEGKDSPKMKSKSPYAICNLPEGTDDLFYEGTYFYVTHELICELKERLNLEVADDDLKTEFYKMELWLESATRKTKDYKKFIANWLAKYRDSSYGLNDRLSGSSQDYKYV